MLGLSVLEGRDNRAVVAEGAQHAPQVTYIEHAGNGSLGRVFDHVGIAVSDLAASERFYRTVLSVLGVEPRHADAELVEWDDWDIGVTDREHPVTRALHVGFRARDRGQVDAFWQAGIDAGYRDDGPPGPRARTPRCVRSMPPRSRRATRITARRGSARCTTRGITARSCSTRTGTTSRSSTTTADEPSRCLFSSARRTAMPFAAGRKPSSR